MFHRGLLVGLASPASRDWGWESVFMFPCFQCQRALCPLWYSFNPLFCFCLCLLAFLLFFFFPCWWKCTENTPHHCIVVFFQSLFFIYVDLRSIKRPAGNSLTTVTSAVVIMQRFWMKRINESTEKTCPSGTSSFLFHPSFILVCYHQSLQDFLGFLWGPPSTSGGAGSLTSGDACKPSLLWMCDMEWLTPLSPDQH